MLPILISIPHGGTEIPAEVADRVALDDTALFDDGDACTRDIYDFVGEVAALARADVARAFVDLNRSPDDRPPANPDGVVKTLTAYRVPVYKPGRALDADLTESLLERYWRPYHAQLERLARKGDVRLAVDCHSMAAQAPAIASDSGRWRPLFCLSNGRGETCPDALLDELADALSKSLALPRSEVSLNDPFSGGYITRHHGRGALPWLQLEMSRALYLAPPWFDRPSLSVDPDRLRALGDGVLRALASLSLLSG